MDVIKEALIIEEDGLRTSCFIVENLPKHFIYHKTKKLMPLEEYSERLVPVFKINERGEKVPTGELVDELNSGIELDGAGSGGFIFSSGTDDSVQRLKAIDEHIERTITDPMLRHKRVPYAQQPGSTMSGPKPYNSIVRVRLPELASPPVAPTTEQAAAAPAVLPVKVKKPLTEEQLAKKRENMAKARAKKVQLALEQIARKQQQQPL